MTSENGRMRPSPKRILIIKPSSLGDIIHALPVLAGLRKAHPAAHITWLVATPFASLLVGHPMLNEVISFDRHRYGSMPRSPRAVLDFCRFVADLRRHGFDLVLDLQGLFRSGFLALATGARRRVGFSDARELASVFYSQRIPGARTAAHAVDVNLGFARTLGLPVDPPAFPLGVSPQEVDAAHGLLARAAGEPVGEFVALIPGGRWPSKRWPSQRWAHLVTQLKTEGYPRCVLLGGAGDRQAADELHRACGTAVVDLVGRTTLRQLTTVISLAKLVVCHDSGPMHIAAALGKPLVALFGPTSPARTGPYSPSARVVALPLSCVPCYRRICPLGHHKCMGELAVEAVLQEVRELRIPQPQPTAARVSLDI